MCTITTRHSRRVLVSFYQQKTRGVKLVDWRHDLRQMCSLLLKFWSLPKTDLFIPGFVWAGLSVGFVTRTTQVPLLGSGSCSGNPLRLQDETGHPQCNRNQKRKPVVDHKFKVRFQTRSDPRVQAEESLYPTGAQDSQRWNAKEKERVFQSH